MPRPRLAGGQSSTRIVHAELDVKCWRARLPSADEVRPASCPSCGAASRPAGGRIVLRQLLVVIDSLQKLPMELEDRRAGVDGWIRLLERLRHEHDAAVLLISEIKRDQKGQYTAHEAAFKESGGIEYAADLAMTMTRPTANESAEACSTLRIELARECEEDPPRVVAGYRALFPYYGLEEVEPDKRQAPARNGPSARRQARTPAFVGLGGFDADP